MRAEALKGHLDALLLAALEPGPAHGFAVMAELRRRTEGAIDLEGGTLYPALRRLEEAGLIVGTWTNGSGRRRREYQLTEKGRRDLAAQRGRWREFVTTLTVAMDPAAGKPSWTPA
ncbi:helix-turn-helix transcriptional regulator [Pseudonocardia eucalypti]|uniref:Helix-turn-helix transcriptional regulator n=1 Tax=Pseudonocardia eucalypti TaxID=648755 RepID=A0ABP9PZ59_9PSEU|nr:DNA-binding PadR family transcriptional regulator [Pseudonocardia eucalypti]